MIDLFQIQPASCREKLEYRDVELPRYWKETDEAYNSRISLFNKVLYTDPTAIFERIRLAGNPLLRHNTSCSIGIQTLFPNNGNMCACGCERELTGRQKRWATEKCADYPLQIYFILSGRVEQIRKYIWHYQYGHCTMCGDKFNSGHLSCEVHEYELDHIVPVHKGGGCCWLSNYQLIHTDCHKQKTKQDLAA